MTTRQVRRAQERKARKQARKAANSLTANSSTIIDTAVEQAIEHIEADDSLIGTVTVRERPFEIPMPEHEPRIPSEAQLTANRANSQLSCGPKTPEGKAKSSLNAVTTALTGRTVLLPSDDVALYEQHLRDFEKELRPMNRREIGLVQSLADIEWRRDRIPALQMAIFAKGRVEFANLFDEYPAAQRPMLIELHTFITYEKQLRNLQIQEARLWRQREKSNAELRQMQQERHQREKQDLETLGKLYMAAKHDKKPFDPVAIGFDYSIEDVELYLEGVRAANIANVTLKQEREHAKSYTKAA